jgi:hypothetical protein
MWGSFTFFDIPYGNMLVIPTASRAKFQEIRNAVSM